MPTIDDMSSTGQPDEPQSRLARILGVVPRALSSKPHIIFLACLGIYLVLLPLFQVHVSAFSELVGGNYTNVTSDLGACIAAGGTIHLIKTNKAHKKEIEKLRSLVEAIHEKL